MIAIKVLCANFHCSIKLTAGSLETMSTSENRGNGWVNYTGWEYSGPGVIHWTRSDLSFTWGSSSQRSLESERHQVPLWMGAPYWMVAEERTVQCGSPTKAACALANGDGMGKEWGSVGFQGWVGSHEVPASHSLKRNLLASWCSAQVKPFDLLQSHAPSLPFLPSGTGEPFLIVYPAPQLSRVFFLKLKNQKLGWFLIFAFWL